MKGFYFITDKGLTKKGILEDVRLALEGGTKIVQYRDKDASTRDMIMRAAKIKEMTQKNNAILIINDRLDIALAADADGIHVGQDDMPVETAKRLFPGKIIGVTAHNVEEAIEAEKGGASYLGVSPVFTTTTKLDAGEATGIEMVRKIREKTRIPLVGIGGITIENAPEVIRAGADGICAISATVGKDVKAEVEKFERIINEAKNDTA